MAEPQTAMEGRAKSGADAGRGRGDGPATPSERGTWADPGPRAKQAAEQQAAAAEKAGEVLRDWTSTMTAIYARNMSMASCRSRALAEYWDDLARARQPADVVNAGARYWSRMVSDYSDFGVGEGALIKDMIKSARSER